MTAQNLCNVGSDIIPAHPNYSNSVAVAAPKDILAAPHVPGHSRVADRFACHSNRRSRTPVSLSTITAGDSLWQEDPTGKTTVLMAECLVSPSGGNREDNPLKPLPNNF
jgi:hypothetical protein